jgi:hypothetical protein
VTRIKIVICHPSPDGSPLLELEYRLPDGLLSHVEFSYEEAATPLLEQIESTEGRLDSQTARQPERRSRKAPDNPAIAEELPVLAPAESGRSETAEASAWRPFASADTPSLYPPAAIGYAVPAPPAPPAVPEKSGPTPEANLQNHQNPPTRPPTLFGDTGLALGQHTAPEASPQAPAEVPDPPEAVQVVRPSGINISLSTIQPSPGGDSAATRGDPRRPAPASKPETNRKRTGNEPETNRQKPATPAVRPSDPKVLGVAENPNPNNPVLKAQILSLLSKQPLTSKEVWDKLESSKKPKDRRPIGPIYDALYNLRKEGLVESRYEGGDGQKRNCLIVRGGQ